AVASNTTSRDRPAPAVPGASWVWLSIPIALLGVVAAGSGILFDSVYQRDTEHFGVQGMSQDYVTLLVAVPAVLVLGWLAYRGSFAARLMWHGVVFYFAYTYTIAVFMVRFNALFLVYTSLLACSLFALLGGFVRLGWPIDPARFGDRWPRRGVMAFLSFAVVMFAMLWLSDIIPAIIDGVEPQSLAETGTPTNGVEVLDLSLIIPGSVLIAFWVSKRESRGYVLATGLITFIVMLGLALVAMVIGLWAADLTSGLAVSVVFLLFAGIATGLLVAIARSMSGLPDDAATPSPLST
ncbi:MAG: hypothetical protein ABFR89_13070, partial [Actinomycetota bacterium]